MEFLEGAIEAIPLPDSSIDVIISNCVINLSTDKPAVFAQAFRVLTARGAEDHLTVEQRAQRGSYVGDGRVRPTVYTLGLHAGRRHRAQGVWAAEPPEYPAHRRG